jgi:hypothetical protein
MYKRELLKRLLRKEIPTPPTRKPRKSTVTVSDQPNKNCDPSSPGAGIRKHSLGSWRSFRSIDMAAAWELAAPESKRRVQTFLFSGGLSYSEKTESLNPSNTSLFSALEVLYGPESRLACPTGFEPVLSP